MHHPTIDTPLQYNVSTLRCYINSITYNSVPSTSGHDNDSTIDSIALLILSYGTDESINTSVPKIPIDNSTTSSVINSMTVSSLTTISSPANNSMTIFTTLRIFNRYIQNITQGYSRLRSPSIIPIVTELHNLLIDIFIKVNGSVSIFSERSYMKENAWY